jgi:hypothetical protein
MATRERIRIERKQPLPPGRYWIDIIGQENINAWGEYLKLQRGSVRQLTVEEDRNADPPTLWTLFEVPVEGRLPGQPIFDQRRFGFPNTAPEGVSSKQDTESGPGDEDEESDITKAVKVLALVGVALGVTVGVFLIASWVDSKRKQLAAGGPVSGTREREREAEAA